VIKRSSGSIKPSIWGDFFFFLSDLSIIKLEKETMKGRRNSSHSGTVCNLLLLNTLPVPSHLCIPTVLCLEQTQTFPPRSTAVVSKQAVQGSVRGYDWRITGHEREQERRKKRIF